MDSKWRIMELSCSKKLSVLLRATTSKHHGDFYCLNCVHSFVTENNHESHKKVCENKYFCNIVMPSEDCEILEFNQYQNSDKNLECLIEKINECKNNTENLSTTKVTEHIRSGFSMST